MQLPFTPVQFYDIFRNYNEAVWPTQLALFGLAVICIVLVFRPRLWSHVVVSGILAGLWAWLAIAYHLAFFARINPLAYAFSVLSLFGAVVFVWEGLVRRRLRYEWSGSMRSWIGAALIGFSLIVYPAWSWWAGHTYPYMPTFGLPCPVTLYTVGILAFLKAPYPRVALAVPIIWSAIGVQAAFLLGVPQDYSLMAAGIFGIFLLLRNGRSGARNKAETLGGDVMRLNKR